MRLSLLFKLVLLQHWFFMKTRWSFFHDFYLWNFWNLLFFFLITHNSCRRILKTLFSLTQIQTKPYTFSWENLEKINPIPNLPWKKLPTASMVRWDQCSPAIDIFIVWSLSLSLSVAIDRSHLFLCVHVTRISPFKQYTNGSTNLAQM